MLVQKDWGVAIILLSIFVNSYENIGKAPPISSSEDIEVYTRGRYIYVKNTISRLFTKLKGAFRENKNAK